MDAPCIRKDACSQPAPNHGDGFALACVGGVPMAQVPQDVASAPVLRGGDGYEPALEHLFSYRHLRGPWTPWRVAVIALYAPLGVALACVRALGFVVVAALLWALPGALLRPNRPPPFVVRCVLLCFGIVVRLRHTHHLAAASLIASSHHSSFDVLPFAAARGIHVLVDQSFYANSIVAPFLRPIGALTVNADERRTAEGRAHVRTMLVDHLAKSSHPLLFFPEGWDTNGQHGLMQYNQFLFSLGLPVVPAALRVRVPLPGVGPSMLGSSVGRELLWLLWYPYIVFEVHFLPPMHPLPDEDGIAFAARVQQATAHHMGIHPTAWTQRHALALRRSLTDVDRARLQSHVNSAPEVVRRSPVVVTDADMTSESEADDMTSESEADDTASSPYSSVSTNPSVSYDE